MTPRDGQPNPGMGHLTARLRHAIMDAAREQDPHATFGWQWEEQAMHGTTARRATGMDVRTHGHTITLRPAPDDTIRIDCPGTGPWDVPAQATPMAVAGMVAGMGQPHPPMPRTP